MWLLLPQVPPKPTWHANMIQAHSANLSSRADLVMQGRPRFSYIVKHTQQQNKLASDSEGGYAKRNVRPSARTEKTCISRGVHLCDAGSVIHTFAHSLLLREIFSASKEGRLVKSKPNAMHQHHRIQAAATQPRALQSNAKC